MRRRLENKNIRKILKNGDSYAITLPIDMVRKLGWREKQKVVVELNGQKITVKDWKK
jgi:antitoxin component of MazEF toxin-antitoxin module